MVQRKWLRYGALGSLLITAVGLASYTLYAEGLSLFALIWPRLVTGLGIGMLFPMLASAAYTILHNHKTEAAASILVFATLFGTEPGIELLGLLLQNVHDHSLNSLSGYQTVFWVQVALTLMCLLLVVFIPERQRTLAYCARS